MIEFITNPHTEILNEAKDILFRKIKKYFKRRDFYAQIEEQLRKKNERIN